MLRTKSKHKRRELAGEILRGRYYGVDQFEILGVCLGKKTGYWTDLMFINSRDLMRHASYPNKLAVMQRVPLPGATDITPWFTDLAKFLSTLQ